MSNRALRMIFDRAADGLPLAEPELAQHKHGYGKASEVS